MNSHPNIIYIFCDDLGWGDVSCLNPDSRIMTPQIDSLAAGGISFTDAHAASAVCTPSRYSLMTGRYCWRSRLKQGVNSGYSPALITPERMTVAGMLRTRGYRSACFGKWHIGLDWAVKDESAGRPPQVFKEDEEISPFDPLIDFTRPVRNGPVDVGFDTFFGISGSLDMSPYVFIEDDRVIEPPTGTVQRGNNPEARAREGIAAAGWRHEDVLPALQRRSIDFIHEQAAAGNPFFLYVPLNAPHTPVVPNKEFIGKSGCGIYGDFVTEIDSVVGNIVNVVRSSGIENDTLIFFSSDNGPELLTAAYRRRYGHYSAWRFRGMKRDNWEGGHRVPLIASWPGTIPPGVTCDRFVELTDFFATVAAIVDFEVPPDAAEDSYNMLPLLLGEDVPDYREFAIHHSLLGRWAIRRGPWKLLLHRGSGGVEPNKETSSDPVQLYDMENDPFETNNLFSEHRDVVRDLKSLCLEQITRGRSTPGPARPNDPDGDWQQLKELVRQDD